MFPEHYHPVIRCSRANRAGPATFRHGSNNPHRNSRHKAWGCRHRAWDRSWTCDFYPSWKYGKIPWAWNDPFSRKRWRTTSEDHPGHYIPPGPALPNKPKISLRDRLSLETDTYNPESPSV